MILSTIQKLNKIYKETQFYYRYVFILSFLTSLTLSIFEGFFLSVIFNLTNNLNLILERFSYQSEVLNDKNFIKNNKSQKIL